MKTGTAEQLTPRAANGSAVAARNDCRLPFIIYRMAVIMCNTYKRMPQYWQRRLNRGLEGVDNAAASSWLHVIFLSLKCNWHFAGLGS